MIAGVPATVTSTGRLMPFDPGALIAMAALNVPPPCRLAGFTVTCRVAGSVPEEGDTVSQFPLLLVTGVAVNELVEEPVVDIVTICVTGTVLLAAKLKLSDVGLADSGLGPPVELALNCTGTDWNDPAEELMLINPTSVPEVGAVEPIDTDSVAGVTPLVGLTMSQLLLEKADTVKFTCPPEFVICNVCAGADAPLKTSCGGKAVSELP